MVLNFTHGGAIFITELLTELQSFVMSFHIKRDSLSVVFSVINIFIVTYVLAI